MPDLAPELAALLLDDPGATADHTYTYLFTDLRTDAVLAELPLAGVTYSYELGGIGTLRATIPYTDETLPLDPDTASLPARTALWVDRDGVIVWAGIIWTRQPVAGGKAIQASEFLSYYQHRYVKTTLATDTSLLTNTAYVPAGQRLYSDQRYVVWSLLRYAHAQPGGDIGIDITPLGSPATGITRNVSYFGYERPEIYRAIADLAAAEDGFDFGVEVGWTTTANNVAPRRYKRARVWYPRRGRAYTQSGLVFTTGGPTASILDYDWPEDGTSLATEVTALGAGSGEARLVKTVAASDLISAGWPLLEAVETHSDMVDEAQLQGTATAALTARSRADVQPTFEVSADTDPAFGSYEVGDEALFVIEPEPRMPAGREQVLRILSIEVTAASGPERVRLSCAAA